MIRTVAALLALALLSCLLPALAEGGIPEGALPEDTPLSVDLDGDGTPEQVSWAMVRENEYDAYLTFTVRPAGSGATTYRTDIIQAEAVCALDLDGDGAVELLASGDVMSDDYYTWCLRYRNGAMYEVLFPDGNRGKNDDAYYKYGYGRITGVDGSRLTLCGSQDVLGTWFGCRTVELAPSGHFEFCDAGFWIRQIDDADLADLWRYAALTTTVELPYMGEDGQAGVLPPGTKLLIRASDKRETAWFTTSGMVNGRLSISRNEEQGWGWMVDGIPEEDCFEYVLYAD